MFKPKKILGVDIGSSGVRLAEITKRDNHAQLTNYGYLNFPRPINTNLASSSDRQIAHQAINEICRRAKFTTTRAYSTIPGHCTINQLFNFDRQTPKEVIESWLKNNMPAQHFDSTPLIKWQKIDIGTGKNRSTIHASAADKNVINNYQSLFKETALDLQGLETTYHALGRCLAGSDRRPTMLIDAGDQHTDITITQHGYPLITHSVKFGGNQITAQLAKHLNIDSDQAEQFKKDRQVAVSTEEDSLSQITNKQREKLEVEIREMLTEALRKNIEVDKIIVSGGCAGDKEFTTWLERALNIKAYSGNSWGRIVHRSTIKPLLEEITHYFPVAVGAAMKGLE